MAAATTRQRLRECLGDADYPASKSQLIETAQRNCGQDEEVVRALRAIPAEEYRNFTELLGAVPLRDEADRRWPAAQADAEKAAAHRNHAKPGLAESSRDVPAPSPITEELGEWSGA
jgi:hypothetical protein